MAQSPVSAPPPAPPAAPAQAKAPPSLNGLVLALQQMENAAQIAIDDLHRQIADRDKQISDVNKQVSDRDKQITDLKQKCGDACSDKPPTANK